MANLIFRKNGTNYTIDGLIAGTGHLIKNSSGQEVTDRQYLQFNGAYLSDDSVGDATEVNVVRTMTQAQFNNLSAAEKEGLIYISDAAGQLTASEVALAAIAGMSATTVQSGIAELKGMIPSSGFFAPSNFSCTNITPTVNAKNTIFTNTGQARTVFASVVFECLLSGTGLVYLIKNQNVNASYSQLNLTAKDALVTEKRTITLTAFVPLAIGDTLDFYPVLPSGSISSCYVTLEY